MPSVFLILGSNLGNCLETLEKAKVSLDERVGAIVDMSPIYQSEPWGFKCENWFYNQVINCETMLSPEAVLNEILNIETELGRTRHAENAYESRIIDIDILSYGNEIIAEKNLEIPHKQMKDRKFVLLPLNDIAPDWIHPVLKKTTRELLENCTDKCVAKPYMQLPDLARRYPYIAIEGTIGVGKTTLATMLSETFKAKLVLEKFDTNPFLPKFYENPDKYAFPVELSFLAERFQQLQENLTAPDLFHDMVVSDYITEKSLIFAGKTLSEDMFALYAKLFHIIFASLPKPDLLVYLYASPEKLKKNIVKRGRDYEQNIELEYLTKLQNGYMEHFKSLPNQRTLIIDVNRMDFANNLSDYHKILVLLNEPYPVGVTVR